MLHFDHAALRHLFLAWAPLLHLLRYVKAEVGMPRAPIRQVVHRVHFRRERTSHGTEQCVERRVVGKLPRAPAGVVHSTEVREIRLNRRRQFGVRSCHAACCRRRRCDMQPCPAMYRRSLCGSVASTGWPPTTGAVYPDSDRWRLPRQMKRSMPHGPVYILSCIATYRRTSSTVTAGPGGLAGQHQGIRPSGADLPFTGRRVGERIGKGSSAVRSWLAALDPVLRQAGSLIELVPGTGGRHRHGQPGATIT